MKNCWMALALFAVLGASIAGCGKLNLGGGGGGPTASPSASPSTSPTPLACNTPDSYDPNLVVVTMGLTILPTSAPPYGSIAGYSLGNLNTGTFSTVAQLIDQTLPSGGTKLTSQNVLQFTNVESQSSAINHSAVGFKGDAFPNPETYVFPTAAASPTASQVSTTSLWSTGRIPPGNCFSQVFKLTPGTYYFGDLDFYKETNFKDVIIVATPGPARRRHV